MACDPISKILDIGTVVDLMPSPQALRVRETDLQGPNVAEKHRSDKAAPVLLDLGGSWDESPGENGAGQDRWA